MYGIRLVLTRSLMIAALALITHQTLTTIGARCACKGADTQTAYVTVSNPTLQIAEPGKMLSESEQGNIQALTLTPGTEFGWRMSLNSPVQAVRLTEELVLPAPAATWNVSDRTTLDAERRIARTSTVLPGGAYDVGNGWLVTEGDPAGEYQMNIYLDGQLVQSFRFNAVEAKSGGCTKSDGHALAH